MFVEKSLASSSTAGKVQSRSDNSAVFKTSYEARGVGSSNLSRGTNYFPATVSPEQITYSICQRFKIADGDRVLEPSAGSGGMVKVIREYTQDIVAVELGPNQYNELALIPHLLRYRRDFLRMSPDTGHNSPRGPVPALGLFDYVIMCPPKRSVEHISHALTFLKPGGKLAALVQDQNMEDAPDTWELLPTEEKFVFADEEIPCSLLYLEN